VIEPELPDGDDLTPDLLEAHSMNPLKVLRAVRAMGGKVRRVLIAGCEPTPIDVNSDSEICGELSPPVLNAIEPAARLIESLVTRLSTSPSNPEVCHESVSAHA
jgi:hydrogenase maturation protease